MSQIIKVSEIFGPTLQGEGALIGKPTLFVRTGGCDFRCSWCDTLFAVDPKFNQQWTGKSASEIFREVQALSNDRPMLITLSGGNPALQPLQSLIELGHDRGYEFALETQGTIHQDWFKDLDYLTISPKPPSSDMPFDPQQLQNCIDAAGSTTNINLKFVIANEQDFNWSYQVARSYPDLPCYIQPCNLQTASSAGRPSLQQSIEQVKWLNDLVNQHGWYRCTVLPQLHLWLWNGERGF